MGVVRRQFQTLRQHPEMDNSDAPLALQLLGNNSPEW